MNLKKHIPYLAIAASFLFMTSCKEKDNDVTIADPLSGKISIDMPAYLKKGDRLSTLVATSDLLKMVERPDGLEDGIALCFKVTPGMSAIDTFYRITDDPRREEYIDMWVPDTLTTISLTITAFAPDKKYSAISSSFSAIVVDDSFPSESLTYNASAETTGWPLESDGSFTDSRDGKNYVTCNYAGKEWMKQNLAWEGSGQGYRDYEVMTNAFGRYYTWEEAQTACPEGWHLATDADWDAVTETAGDNVGSLLARTYFNGASVWKPNREVIVPQESILSIGMFGFAQNGPRPYTFSGVSDYAVFWTESTSENGYGNARYFAHGKNIIYKGSFDKESILANVRCVR